MSKEVMQRETTVAESDRLDSWKEIATYLGRQVRTVQRWEKQEELPVHRHQHDKFSTVYAYKSELDAWLSSRARLAASTNSLDAATSDDMTYDSAAPSDFTDDPAAPVALPASRFFSGKAMAAALLVGLIVIAVAAYLTGWRAYSTNAITDPRIRLAVLPFENLGGNPDQEWFSDGLTEEMITQLGRIQPERLGVIGRASVMRYKATKKSLEEIGGELNVDYILEGSVRRESERVRVTAQLIRVSDQMHLWAGTFDKDLPGILALQSEIATRIAHSFAPKLLENSSAITPRASTDNPAALDEYLKGRYTWNRGAFEKSLEYFEQGVKLDPGFALAYTGLAEAHAMLGRYGRRPSADAFPKAKAAAEKAIEMDDTLAEAHSALALVKFYWDWDWAGAEKEFLRAIEINRALANAHHGYAHFLSAMGRHDEAIREVKLAEQLEPLSATINSDAGWFYFRARRFDEAIAVCRRAIEIEPTFSSAQTCIIDSLIHEGRFNEAWQEARGFLKSPEEVQMIAKLAGAEPKEALRKIRLWRLEQLRLRAKSEYVPPYQFVSAYAGLDERDSAFEWLEKGYVARDRIVLLMKVHPMFDPLRSDPRFDNLMRRVGLPAS
ncbi:MAG: hypothetical protein WBV94_07995 [Blastocatellia bacterium]